MANPLGARWPTDDPAAPYVLAATDGRELTVTEYFSGVTLTDDRGDEYVLPHVEADPDDPNRLRVAGRWFRLEGA